MIHRSLLEMPRMLPKRKCVRSTGTRLYLSRMMPSENATVYSAPMAVSSFKRELRATNWPPIPTSNAAIAAPLNSPNGARPKKIAPTASPGKSEWLKASASSASRRRTIKALKKPLVKPTSKQPSNARCMNS